MENSQGPMSSAHTWCYDGTAAEGASSQQFPQDEDENLAANPSRHGVQRALRGSNFSEKEDELLISAWMNVSMDVAQGTNQSSSTYWGRIKDYYDEYKASNGITQDRPKKSLTTRWSCIQESVNKFCGALAQVEARNQSGYMVQDKVYN